MDEGRRINTGEERGRQKKKGEIKKKGRKQGCKKTRRGDKR